MIKFNLAKTMFIIAMSIFCFGIFFCGCNNVERDSENISPKSQFENNFSTCDYYSKTGIHYQLIWFYGYPSDFKIINITEDSLYQTLIH